MSDVIYNVVGGHALGVCQAYREEHDDTTALFNDFIEDHQEVEGYQLSPNGSMAGLTLKRGFKADHRFKTKHKYINRRTVYYPTTANADGRNLKRAMDSLGRLPSLIQLGDDLGVPQFLFHQSKMIPIVRKRGEFTCGLEWANDNYLLSLPDMEELMRKYRGFRFSPPSEIVRA